MRRVDIVVGILGILVPIATCNVVRSQLLVCYSAATAPCGTLVDICEATQCQMDANSNVFCPTPQGQVLNQPSYNTTAIVNPPAGSDDYETNEPIACILTQSCIGGNGNCVRIIGVLYCATDESTGTYDDYHNEESPSGNSCQQNEA
jgi:hypothetical protein